MVSWGVPEQSEILMEIISGQGGSKDMGDVGGKVRRNLDVSFGNDLR